MTLEKCVVEVSCLEKSAVKKASFDPPERYFSPDCVWERHLMMSLRCIWPFFSSWGVGTAWMISLAVKLEWEQGRNSRSHCDLSAVPNVQLLR